MLLIAGMIAIIIAVRAQRAAPQPPPAAASPVNVITTAEPSMPGSTVPGPTRTPGNSAAEPKTLGPILAHSIPIRLQIPAINVDSTLNKIGLNSTGEISTPPLAKDSHAY